MHSTKTPFTSAFFALITIAVASAAHAQQPSTSSRAQRLEWPRTFSGQPDFAFTREEALAEARTRATRENEPLPLTPSIEQLINDDSALDPLGQLKPVVSLSEDPSATLGQDPSTTAPRGQSLMERLMAQAVDLPTVPTTAKPDLTEFSSQLSATISNTVANWQPQAGAYNFEGVLQGLVLQAIVTSPVKYAVINQQRYVEGETFRITVPLAVPESEITSAMQARMPVSGTLPESVMASYTETYKNILDGFRARRMGNPSLGQQTLVLPVRITAIAPRQVLLDVNGQSYALNIRYAY